jgi:hypothetical protein
MQGRRRVAVHGDRPFVEGAQAERHVNPLGAGQTRSAGQIDRSDVQLRELLVGQLK